METDRAADVALSHYSNAMSERYQVYDWQLLMPQWNFRWRFLLLIQKQAGNKGKIIPFLGLIHSCKRWWLGQPSWRSSHSNRCAHKIANQTQQGQTRAGSGPCAACAAQTQLWVPPVPTGFPAKAIALHSGHSSARRRRGSAAQHRVSTTTMKQDTPNHTRLPYRIVTIQKPTRDRWESHPARETESIFHGKTTAHLKHHRRQQIPFADSANSKGENKDDLSLNSCCSLWPAFTKMQ